MNWQHLRTFLWLRARIRSNQWKRAGSFSRIISGILLVGGIVGAAGAFVVSLILGRSGLLSQADPPILMLVWDGYLAGFLFFWMIGLLSELQRSEVLSMEKFLHLPVSLNSVFVINYVGTIFCPTVILFLPAMIGLSIGLVWSRGPAMLWLFPMVAGFILAVTAITYQFQGWLASLMENKRRRRTVVAVASMVFMLIVQLPNLLRFSFATTPARQRTVATRLLRASQERDEFESVERIATIANAAIPLAWPAYGAMATAQGKRMPAALAVLGLSLIGAASLGRTYRTTLRLYTGEYSSSKPRERAATDTVGAVQANASRSDAMDRASFKHGIRAASSSCTFLERQLPGLSEPASAIALACFRSLTRAPEAKMLLMTPIFMAVIFGSMLLRRSADPPEFVRPLYAAGGITMILFSLVQLAGNQFGFDRSGFRTFILSAAPRKDILFGKNLALMPLALGLSTVVIIPLQIVYPMRVDHFLAVMVQMIAMFLSFSIVANFLSILAPTPIAAGSLRPVRPKGFTMLVHFAFVFLFPVALSPTLLPLGIEYLLRGWGWPQAAPVYLLLTVLESAAIVYLYPHILDIQGDMLAVREQQILEVVTSKVE
jgi:hypothetical protein